MKITWLTQGGFLFESGGTRLLVDPYASDFLEKNHHLTRLAPFPLPLQELRPDWYFCTHDHLDHFDPETVAAVAAAYPDCRFAGPQSCYNHFLKLEILPERCLLLQMTQPAQLGAFRLTPVSAFHSDPYSVGSLIEADGRKLYLSGDSNDAPELVNDLTRTADAVLICVNGKLNNMPADAALRVVEAIRPQVAIPMHYGLFAENTVEPDWFIENCLRLGIHSFAMTAGKEFVL